MQIIYLLILLSVAFMGYNCSTGANEHLVYQRLSPCRLGEYDTTSLCGTFAVHENTQTRSGRKINLNIVVIPAIYKTNNVPIFVLEGGPGIGATVGGSFYADTLNYYCLNHDVVLIDVRGTGQSNPLHCRQLQFKENLESRLGEMYPAHAVKDCYDSLSRLADLTQYTTSAMAMDIEEVREWLGYDKISLYGHSFGGRLAQVYMKMFPSSVASAFLWSPATTDLKIPLYHAPFAQGSMDKLFKDCEEDSLCHTNFPNINKEFKDLMRRGREVSFKYQSEKENGEALELTISWDAFQTKIRSLMYSPYGLKMIPFIIHESFLGNWQPFISLYPSVSTYDDFLAEGLYLCITCTEDVPFITQEEVDSLTGDTFTGDSRVIQQQIACSNWTKGTVPPGFSEPLVSNIPTLVISGYFDPVTQTSIAETIVETLPNSILITIPEMSHLYDGLSNPDCFDKIVVDFLDHPDVKPDDDCIKKMLPPRYKTKK